MSDRTMVLLGFLVISVGLLLAIVALVLTACRSGKSRGRAGAVVIIGPFPIVFGCDWRSTRQLLVLSIVLVVGLIVLYLIQGL